MNARKMTDEEKDELADKVIRHLRKNPLRVVSTQVLAFEIGEYNAQVHQALKQLKSECLVLDLKKGWRSHNLYYDGNCHCERCKGEPAGGDWTELERAKWLHAGGPTAPSRALVKA